MISEITDREELSQFLLKDPVGNAYLLGDLDPVYMPFCRWYGYRQALLLHYRGLSLPAVLTATNGDTGLEALKTLIAETLPRLPQRFLLHAREHHSQVLEGLGDLGGFKRVVRMGLKKDRYKKHPAGGAVRRLTHADTIKIMQLYEHFPDNFFEPYQLESGFYFGIENDDKSELAAIAGVHVYNPELDIAAIGNLVVRPDYRRRGYATEVTETLLSALFEHVSLVTLNVSMDNIAAVSTFEKFGFERHHVYYEGCVTNEPE